MQSVWKMCFSSQCSVVTKSLRRKSLQQIGHWRHKPFSLIASPPFFFCCDYLCLNFVLSRDEIISGTGRGTVSSPPNIPSMKRLPPSCSSTRAISSWNCYKVRAYRPSLLFRSCSRSRRRIRLIRLWTIALIRQILCAATTMATV